jgi:hypothetical protein
MAGWFASRPEASKLDGPKGNYTKYGYAGYDFSTYDVGCVSTITHADSKLENTVANGEFMVATGIIGAANALRERAWDPREMWGWANPLVQRATRAVYEKVFTVFGAVTLAVIGLYLLWRSRQADMSSAMTTAGWALLVMVLITAIAKWPTASANLADSTLIGSLSVVHSAVGPPAQNSAPGDCILGTEACTDHRTPAVRASDTATDNLVYNNWLRGTLGSADSTTARKYGPVLYDAKSFTWGEIEDIRRDPAQRDVIVQIKNEHWFKVAEQIKVEDPEAYEYLQGEHGMDRVGAGFIAILAAIFFALFDLTASLLVLLGFLIFRWAVIAAPILGTVGMLRPASAGLRRLVNAVVAAIFNIVIFGTGSAIYLFGVDLIMSTPSLPGWLQVVLVWLTGMVGWLLLRPYRRITQLGGKDPTTAVASAGTWHRRFFRDLRQAAPVAVATPDGTPTQPGGKRELITSDASPRPETRAESAESSPVSAGITAPPVPSRARTGRPPAAPAEWAEPEVPDPTPSYAIYRPAATRPAMPATTRTGTKRRPESVAR